MNVDIVVVNFSLLMISIFKKLKNPHLLVSCLRAYCVRSSTYLRFQDILSQLRAYTPAYNQEHLVMLVVDHTSHLFFTSVTHFYMDYNRVRQNKISQRENCDIYITQEYFYTKFSTFIYHICLHKSVNLIFGEVAQQQSQRSIFANQQL